MIATPTGEVPVESLQIGDFVLSPGLAGTNVASRIRNIFHTTSPGYLLINGQLRVTRSHPFASKGTWREARALSVGDEVQGRIAPIRVNSIEFVNKGVRVYNLNVDGSHTFFVDGFLVHNKDGYEQNP